ncbi:Molybdenum cofactor guanylyltransferase [Methyloligella halotolerans]|uniref:Molybdenum cofactor guanylyltransferase n=1 Tax=Methyloligella halotolerans TaxID=1177755 RepID=A0A1E2RUX9_9HYPH|nr:molybdenum cofactor guanylyltransferase MobA [Methyloligella halotolerans]ODA66011.1 Molybdenum cofactor guanylyltransferase [Methyloligella halotolerans]
MSFSGHPAAGLLLAGGRSSRFGADKSFATLDGAQLVDRAIARLKPQVARLAINSNGDPAGFAGTGLPVIADPIAGYAGPLAGVLAGLIWLRKTSPEIPALVTAAVDTPFFPETLVETMLSQSRGRSLVMAASESGTHPTFALWPAGLETELADYLERGGRKLHDWMARQEAAICFFPAVEIKGELVDPFFNINRPDQREAAEALLQRD